jgi:hypothetical protein
MARMVVRLLAIAMFASTDAALAQDISQLIGNWNSDSVSENIEIRANGDVLDGRLGQGRIASTVENGANFVIIYQDNSRCWFYATIIDGSRMRLANRSGANASEKCLFGQFTRIQPLAPDNSVSTDKIEPDEVRKDRKKQGGKGQIQASDGLSEQCREVIARYQSGVTPQTRTPLQPHNAFYMFRRTDGNCGWGAMNRRRSQEEARRFALSRCKEFEHNAEVACTLVGLDGKIIPAGVARLRRK